METQIQNNQDFQLEELTPEKIKELVERASPLEQKYLLILKAYGRQGPAFDNYQKFEIIYGEADIIELNCWDT